MSSIDPNAPPTGYQIGAGTSVNQQYLEPQGAPTATHPSSAQQQQVLSPGHPDSFAPPPAPRYNPGAPDIYSQDSQKHLSPASQVVMSGGAGPPQQSSQPSHPPPPQHGSPQPPGHAPQQYFPPPPQQGSGNPQPQGQATQQHYPSPLQAPVVTQALGQGSQQYPPPPHNPDGYHDTIPPLQPPRPNQQIPDHTPQQYPPAATQQYPPPPQNPDGYHDAIPPPQPPRPNQQISGQTPQQYPPAANTLMTTASGGYPVPPQRHNAQFGNDDPSSPIHYTRDPHKLVAYLVPFPKPQIKGVAPAAIPDRFLIYTPPPPPLAPPKEGEKEDKLHKVQRKWQEEVRAAKTSDAKTASWKGVKSKATKGISYVMSKTTTSNLDFVNRIPGAKADPKDRHADDGVNEGDTTHKTVGLEEMILVYPSSFGANPDQVRTEFINTMMRTKSKAQKDAVLATGLLPVTAAIDILATVVWPFGGLLEVDGVWAYSSIRGAKTARSVTKRLSSSTQSGTTHNQTEEHEMQSEKLRMTFTQSPRLEVLYRYLLARCKDYDHKHFPSTDVAPTESEVLTAIGWAPSQTGNVNKNWEDEEWETQEVKDDVKSTLGKAGKEWDKWCQAFAKNPEKALKK